MTVVGPELPLSLGLADRFAVRRTAAVRTDCRRGPPRIEQGVREGLHGAPCACRRRASSCRVAGQARAAVAGRLFGFPVVLKADGLAAGKGVVIADDAAAADAAIVAAMADRKFGARRRADGDRGMSERARRSRSSSSATAPARCRSDRPRITSASSTTIVGRIPAEWARSRRARCSTPALEARVMREIVEPVHGRNGRRRTPVPRVSLRRPDAHRRVARR